MKERLLGAFRSGALLVFAVALAVYLSGDRALGPVGVAATVFLLSLLPWDRLRGRHRRHRR